MVSNEQLKKIERIANLLRQDVIKMVTKAGSGHPAGSLGMADVFAALYFYVLGYDSKNFNWPDRDRLVLSNGHICPVLYAAMSRAGFFSVEELMTLRKFGSRIQGHPHRESLPGLETSSGPVAHGSSVALGMALAGKIDKKKYQVYCLVGDGEQDEGQTWEAAAMAGKYRLDNLTFIMDRNNIQIDGYTEDVMPKEPLDEKYRAFGWHVIDIDGHNIRQTIEACEQAKAIYEKPVMIIAHTIPGKGVDFMEFDYSWHGKAPSEKEAEEALWQLKEQARRL